MARPTEWRRTWESYVGGSAYSSLHQVKLCDLAPGETITRVRFWWWGAQYPSNPFLGTGVTFGLGIGVFDGLTPTATPLGDPEYSWLWWEGWTLETDVFALRGDGSEINLLTGPEGKYERDARAQRTNSTEDTATCWLMSHSEDGFQGQHYLSYAASCLVILAP